jgi:hypothetical protein
MHIRIVTFQLDGINESEYLELAGALAPAFRSWPGLRSKTWLADASSNTYGGVYVFDSVDDADASRHTELWEQMHANPVFADLRVVEFGAIEELSAQTSS